MKLYLTFPAGARTDYSAYVIDESVLIRQRLMNDNCKSTVDTCSFQLKYNQTLQAALFTATDWIVCELETDAAVDLFTGVIAPTFGLRKRVNVMPISVEAIDNSYLLNEPINTSFNFPSAIGGTAYKIFDADNGTDNIISELLEDAGYTVPTIVASGQSDITTTIEYVQGTAGDETYREYLDDLLSEYGWVFHFDSSGKFCVYQWDKDTVTSTATIDEDMEIRKGDVEYTGIEVEFAKTATDTAMLLYRDNLPVGQNSDGQWAFTGEAIANNDYYPPDGDVDDIWQNYSTKWLDKPWLSRETRLKNKDLSLIAADATDSTVEFIADPGVNISSSSYEAKRAKVLFRNTSGETAKIYNFEIKGTALYRKYRRYVKCPDTSTNYRKYVARFLYNGTLATVKTAANRFARAAYRVMIYGQYRYYWTDRTAKSVGTIVTVNMTNPSVNQTVVIVERTWNPQRTTYDYVARRITAYSATTVAESGDAPNQTPTAEQTIRQMEDATTLTNTTAIGTQNQTSAVGDSTARAARIYMGYMSGDNGPGFYVKEFNGVAWELRGYMRLRDPSTWLAVDDLNSAIGLDNVGLS